MGRIIMKCYIHTKLHSGCIAVYTENKQSVLGNKKLLPASTRERNLASVKHSWGCYVWATSIYFRLLLNKWTWKCRMVMWISKFIDGTPNMIPHCQPWLLILSGRLRNRHFDFYSMCYDEPEEYRRSFESSLGTTSSKWILMPLYLKLDRHFLFYFQSVSWIQLIWTTLWTSGKIIL